MYPLLTPACPFGVRSRHTSVRRLHNKCRPPDHTKTYSRKRSADLQLQSARYLVKRWKDAVEDRPVAGVCEYLQELSPSQTVRNQQDICSLPADREELWLRPELLLPALRRRAQTLVARAGSRFYSLLERMQKGLFRRVSRLHLCAATPAGDRDQAKVPSRQRVFAIPRTGQFDMRTF